MPLGSLHSIRFPKGQGIMLTQSEHTAPTPG